MGPRVHAPPRRGEGVRGVPNAVGWHRRDHGGGPPSAIGERAGGGSGRSRSVEAYQTALVMIAWLIASVRLQACMPGQGKTPRAAACLARY